MIEPIIENYSAYHRLNNQSKFIFFLANPELPICNRRKRNVKVDRESLLDIRPNLRISLISNDPFREKQNSVDLTWRDVISPTRVCSHSNLHDLILFCNYFPQCSLNLVSFLDSFNLGCEKYAK